MLNAKIINKNNLISNLNFCEGVGKNIIAMVKADAYGHGLKQIVNSIKERVSFWGVANIREALNLKRLLNDRHKILVVGKSNSFHCLIKNNIHFAIDDLSEIKKISNICKKLKKKAYIHIAVNTGMNRIGVKSLLCFCNMLDYINKQKNIVLCGVFTHCYNADETKTHFYSQMKLFSYYVKLINNKNVLIHIGGSFCLNHKIPKFVDMVRVGMFLYGYGNKTLKPVMTIQSKIVKLSFCKKGEFVGYGNTMLKKDSLIATIPIGYADGVPRRLSDRAYVNINGKKCKIVGNICMDMMMVDVTNISVRLNDKVEIYNSANYFAQITDTSPYEILTNFRKCRCYTKYN